MHQQVTTEFLQKNSSYGSLIGTSVLLLSLVVMKTLPFMSFSSAEAAYEGLPIGGNSRCVS